MRKPSSSSAAAALKLNPESRAEFSPGMFGREETAVQPCSGQRNVWRSWATKSCTRSSLSGPEPPENLEGFFVFFRETSVKTSN